MEIEEKLKASYNHEDFINFHRFDKKIRISLEDYVNLILIPLENQNKQNLVEKKEYNASESDFSGRSEPLFESSRNKKPIQLDQLFSSRTKIDINWEHVHEKRILIFGKPGVGKTTLCKKIVYDYYKKNVWKNKFHRVIWLALRDFKHYVKSERNQICAELSDVYTNRFFNNFEDGVAFSDLIIEEEKNGKKILFILDGWDEIGDLLADGHIMKNVLLALLGKQFLIVTSTPYTMGLESFQCDEVLETIGFTRENIFKYIKTVIPGDKDKQNKVLNFVNSHSNIAGMAKIPIQLDMICYLCSSIEDLENCLDTETATPTKLYNVLVKKIMDLNQIRTSGSLTFEWIRDTYKNIFSSKNSKNCSLLKSLAEVAYNTFLQNQIEFSDKLFPSAISSYDDSLDASNKVKESYFLNCLNPSEGAPEKKRYTYIHLTIQEYLAALYIVYVLGKDQLAHYVSEYKYHPRFKSIWSFVAGLIEDSKELDVYFDYLERSPLEITGIPHQMLMITCINECETILSQTRLHRLLDEFLTWLMASDMTLEQLNLQLPNGVYGMICPWIFDLQKRSTWQKCEAYVISCPFLPESIVQKLLDKVCLDAVIKENKAFSLTDKTQMILSHRHGFFGMETVEKIETHLNDVINFLSPTNEIPLQGSKALKLSKAKRVKASKLARGECLEALRWAKVLVDLLVDCNLEDSTYTLLFKLFDIIQKIDEDRWKEVKEKGIQRWRELEKKYNCRWGIMITISTIVGHSSSEYKSILLNKLANWMNIEPSPYYIRKVKIDCLWAGCGNYLPPEIQSILVDILFKSTEDHNHDVLTEYLEAQKELDPNAIEELVVYVETHLNFQCQCNSLQVLSSQQNLTEEILNRILNVFQKTKDTNLMLSIYRFFFCQHKIPNLMTDKLLAPLNRQDILTNAFLPISTDISRKYEYLPLNYNITSLPEQVIEKLGKIFNTHYLQGKYDIVFEILACFKRFQLSIPENMITNLYLYFKSRTLTAELKMILKTIRFQCVFCKISDFSTLLIDLALKNKALVADIKDIFRGHQHLFNKKTTETLDTSTCDNYNENMSKIEILAQNEKIPKKLLSEAISFLITVKSFEQRRITFTLRDFVRQKSLPEEELAHILDINKWRNGEAFEKEIATVVQNVPLSKIFDILNKDNWENVFQHVILERLQLGYHPFPIIQMVEEDKTLGIVIPAQNKPKIINYLTPKYVVNKLRSEKKLKLRPDPLTLYLKFYSKSESLLHIQKLHMDEEIRNMNLLVFTNDLLKYIKFMIYEENPTEDDFKMLFKEIEIRLKDGDFLHLDLRDNHLKDDNVPDLKKCLRNCKKKISTLILSNNQITCGGEGLQSLLVTSFCKDTVNLKYLYLDRNNIYLAQSEFNCTLRNADSLLAQSGLEILDLSGNFIPEGRLGPYFDNILALQQNLLDSGLSKEGLERNVRFIKDSSVLNSCEVPDESFSFIPVHDQFYYLKPDLELPQRISNHSDPKKAYGRIILAYDKSNTISRHFGQSKHAFFGIDWVPPNQRDNFGQRQLIKSELVLNNQDDKNHFRIKIIQISPTTFVEVFSAENVEIRGVISPTTEEISNFLSAIYKSRDTANIYEYKIFATANDSQKGQFNCITWADIMLQQIGINLDTMKTSYPYFHGLLLAFNFWKDYLPLCLSICTFLVLCLLFANVLKNP